MSILDKSKRNILKSELNSTKIEGHGLDEIINIIEGRITRYEYGIEECTFE